MKSGWRSKADGRWYFSSLESSFFNGSDIFLPESPQVLYDLEITSNGPVTTEAEAVIHSTLHIKNEGLSSIRGKKYRFQWIYAPLTLVEKSEHGVNSAIRVTSWFPGIFPVSLQVTLTGCRFCQILASNQTALQVSEFIVGTLVFTQTEDHHVAGKVYPQPASTTPARISFFLHDPSHYFNSASFIYNWDFGDGTELTTEESSIYHNYSSAGTCVVHLDVTAEWRQDETSREHPRRTAQKTGHFVATLELLDAIRSINITGSTEAQVMENVNLSLHIQGSPPLILCWLIKTECISLQGNHCHLVVTNATSYHLNHNFSDPGQYCLSVRVENGVNMLQSYQEIQVRPSGIHPAFLALPCVVLLAAVLGLGVYVTFRGTAQQKDLVEVADFDFSPVSDKAPSSSEWTCSQLCCQTCFFRPSQERCASAVEHRHLLRPLGKPAKMYTA
ncbi:transmembrane protein 130 [Elgaria multicarinata webbii]|uniref:transmembrane protein 130 n=1 Tax=Elgaria multicarinata webbii TaxID=159646 RepID=UPI002FCCF230